MERKDIEDLLSRINGCTFASLDAETVPVRGFRKIVWGQRVMLFTNKTSSGYENMVKRRLAAEGKDPSSFSVSDLPWGERIPETPLISHKGGLYLQTILLEEGAAEYFVGRHQINETDFRNMVGTKYIYGQGLSKANAVQVLAYALDNIKEIRLLGETRPVLSMSVRTKTI